jgi:predicted metal-dependent hydrolase
MLSDQSVQAAIDKGVEEFNRQAFFDCHETLEDLWRIYDGPERECIQGIIQIAVGYHHHLRGNQAGALKLLRRGRERILKFQPGCFGYDTDSLAEAVLLDIGRLTSAPENLSPDLTVPAIGYRRD